MTILKILFKFMKRKFYRNSNILAGITAGLLELAALYRKGVNIIDCIIAG